MDTLKKAVLQLCKLVGEIKGKGVTQGEYLRYVTMPDGTKAQLQIKLVTRESDFHQPFEDVEAFDVLVEGEKTGADLIVDERYRHFDPLGYGPEDDDEYTHDQLAIAAAVYAADETTARVIAPNGSDAWPLAPDADKRNRLDRLRKLVIAGALCAAEVDRLLRKHSRKEVQA